MKVDTNDNKAAKRRRFISQWLEVFPFDVEVVTTYIHL